MLVEYFQAIVNRKAAATQQYNETAARQYSFPYLRSNYQIPAMDAPRLLIDRHHDQVEQRRRQAIAINHKMRRSLRQISRKHADSVESLMLRHEVLQRWLKLNRKQEEELCVAHRTITLDRLGVLRQLRWLQRLKRLTHVKRLKRTKQLRHIKTINRRKYLHRFRRLKRLNRLQGLQRLKQDERSRQIRRFVGRTFIYLIAPLAAFYLLAAHSLDIVVIGSALTAGRALWPLLFLLDS